MSDPLSHAVEVASRAARVAADRLHHHAGGPLAPEPKARFDMVTRADREAEDLIVEILTEAFPDDGILAEEGSHAPARSGRTWVIDPLDGTTNFVHGLERYAVSIGLEVDGEPVVGVVLDVPFDRLAHAVRGQGAWEDGRQLRVSEVDTLGEALVATGFAIRRTGRVDLAELARVLDHVQGVRRAGAAALDLRDVAAGRFDAFWEAGLGPWDTSAGRLLVTEAGGTVSGLPGPYQHHGPIVVSNGRVHRELVTLLGT